MLGVGEQETQAGGHPRPRALVGREPAALDAGRGVQGGRRPRPQGQLPVEPQRPAKSRAARAEESPRREAQRPQADDEGVPRPAVPQSDTL